MLEYRYFVQLSYKGTNYKGWQRQPNGMTVQEAIESKLEILLRSKINTVGCGRTDTGVHASQFFLHFDFDQELDVDWLIFKMNHLLPEDIAFQKAWTFKEDHHSRYHATERQYHYFLHRTKDPFLNGLSTPLKYDLDIEIMNQAGEYLLGIKDFASFCKVGSEPKTTLCDLTECYWKQDGHRWVMTISANRFLRNMVRSVVGTMIDLGRGKITMEEFREIVAAKDRSAAGTSVPPDGLYLSKVSYPFL